MYKRPIYQDILSRVQEGLKFIQVLLGPRQVGKTTLILELTKELAKPCHYVSADQVGLKDSSWLNAQWQVAREKCKSVGQGVFIIDEIQKIPHWAEVVKKLWDEDSRNNIDLKVFMLGSSPWLIQKGMFESLAGRFEQMASAIPFF